MLLLFKNLFFVILIIGPSSLKNPRFLVCLKRRIPEAVTVLFARRYLLNFPDNTALSVRFRSLLVLGEPADTTTIDFDTSDHPDFGSPGRSQNALPRNGHFIISYDVYMLSAVL